MSKLQTIKFLKTINHAFKNELGCRRAIHYLTPPPLAIFWGDAHVINKIECPRAIRIFRVVTFGLSFPFSLIIFNYFRQIRFNFSFFKKTGEKKLPSTLDIEPSTKRQTLP